MHWRIPLTGTESGITTRFIAIADAGVVVDRHRAIVHLAGTATAYTIALVGQNPGAPDVELDRITEADAPLSSTRVLRSDDIPARSAYLDIQVSAGSLTVNYAITSEV